MDKPSAKNFTPSDAKLLWSSLRISILVLASGATILEINLHPRGVI